MRLRETLVVASTALMGCSLFASSSDLSHADPPGQDGGTAQSPEAGAAAEAGTGTDSAVAGDSAATGPKVSLRGTDQYQANQTNTVTLAPPADSQVGDVTWVIIMTGGFPGAAVTPPDDYKLVKTETYACGAWGSTLSIFIHSVTGPEPKSVGFVTPDDGSWHTGVLVALAGAVSSSPIESSNFGRITNNPFVLPALTAGSNGGYGFAVYTGWAAGPATTFSVPKGTDPIIAANGISVFGGMVQPAATFNPGNVMVSPDTCGFAFIALLRLR